MLEDEETAEWGEPLVISLLNQVDALENKDNTMAVYETPEWAQIVARRGPAESAWLTQCPDCSLVNIRFAASGFISDYYTIDYDAKTITWHKPSENGYPDIDESHCAKCDALLPEGAACSVYKAIKGFTVVRN